MVLEILPNEQEYKQEKSLVAIRPVPGRGNGVFALTNIPEGTKICVYPGLVFNRNNAATRGRSGRYAWDIPLVKVKYMPKKLGTDKIFNYVDVDKNSNAKHIIDAGTPDGRLERKYAKYAAPSVNEPPSGDRPNIRVVMAYNRYPQSALEYWSAAPIVAGEELFVCYGAAYERGYAHGCGSSMPAPRYLFGDMTTPVSRETFGKKDHILSTPHLQALLRQREHPKARSNTPAVVQPPPLPVKTNTTLAQLAQLSPTSRSLIAGATTAELQYLIAAIRARKDDNKNQTKKAPQVRKKRAKLEKRAPGHIPECPPEIREKLLSAMARAKGVIAENIRTKKGAGRRAHIGTMEAVAWVLMQKAHNPALQLTQAIEMAHAAAASGSVGEELGKELAALTNGKLRKKPKGHYDRLMGEDTPAWQYLCQ